MVGMNRPSPLATGEAYGASLFSHPRDLPAQCSVKEPGVIAGCRGVMSVRNNAPVDRYRWDATGDTVRCLHCGADVTAATTANVWNEMLSPAVPALPSPSARGNELRAVVTSGLDGVRVTLAEGRPLKAQEYADELAWDALDAIAAGCDDPAELARDLAALRAEVSAAQR